MSLRRVPRPRSGLPGQSGIRSRPAGIGKRPLGSPGGGRRRHRKGERRPGPRWSYTAYYGEGFLESPEGGGPDVPLPRPGRTPLPGNMACTSPCLTRWTQSPSPIVADLHQTLWFTIPAPPSSDARLLSLTPSAGYVEPRLLTGLPQLHYHCSLRGHRDGLHRPGGGGGPFLGQPEKLGRGAAVTPSLKSPSLRRTRKPSWSTRLPSTAGRRRIPSP